MYPREPLHVHRHTYIISIIADHEIVIDKASSLTYITHNLNPTISNQASLVYSAQLSALMILIRDNATEQVSELGMSVQLDPYCSAVFGLH